MKCIDCKSMKIFSIEDGCGSSAKCLKTSKQGKQIYWAMTTLNEDSKDRVVTALCKKEKAPSWCPLRKVNV